MLLLRLFPASIRRAFSLIGFRLRGRVEGTPLFFFGVVLSLAVVFRAGVGLYRDAIAAEAANAKIEVSPLPSPELAQAAETPVVADSASTPASTSTSREPIGAPARVAPKTRGHGRRGSPLHP